MIDSLHLWTRHRTRSDMEKFMSSFGFMFFFNHFCCSNTLLNKLISGIITNMERLMCVNKTLSMSPLLSNQFDRRWL